MAADPVFQTILSTIAVMLTVSAILFVVIGVGLVTTTWWGGSTSVMVRSGIWLGWFWVAVYVSVAHLFFAMQPPVAIPIFIASSIGWLLLARHLIRVRRLEISGSESVTKGELTKIRFARPRWHYVVWALAFALFALLSNQVLRAPTGSVDIGLYHVPYSTLSELYPALSGIANVNNWLGYGHLTDIGNGLLGQLFGATDIYRLLTLLFFASFLIDMLLSLSSPSVDRDKYLMYPRQVFFILAVSALLVYSPWFSIWVSTPKVDSTALIFAVTGIAYLLPTSSNLRLSDYVVSMSAILVSSALRPGNLLLAVLPLIALLFTLRDKRYKVTPTQITTFIIVALGWCVLGVAILWGNIVRTGYALFPVSSWSLSSVDWALPKEAVESSVSTVRAWSISWVTKSPEEVSSVTTLDIFSAAIREPALQLLIGSLLILGGCILYVKYSRSASLKLKKHNSLSSLSITVFALVSLVLIGLRYPQPRYLWAYLIAVSLVPLADLLSKLSKIATDGNPGPFTIASLGLASLMLVIFLQKGFVGSALLNPVVASGPGFFSAELPTIANYATISNESGLKARLPADGLCWNLNPLCSPYSIERLELRGETLREGFRIRQ